MATLLCMFPLWMIPGSSAEFKMRITFVGSPATFIEMRKDVSIISKGAC
jgi:hypothetical protein